MKFFPRREILTRLVLIFTGVLAAILLCEAGLRILSGTAENYYIWPPYFHAVLKPASGIMPGVEGRARFIANSIGLRGDEVPSRCVYKILIMGGSTAECTFLDQPETWPYLLQEKLNRSLAPDNIWVGNAGKSGAYTLHNIIQFKYLLPQYKDIDAVIMIVGINDLTVSFSNNLLYQSDAEEEELFSAFSVIPFQRKSTLPSYKRTALWNTFKKIRYLIFTASENQDIEGRLYIKWRAHRQNASAIRDKLPDMSKPLENYSRNINLIINLCRDRNVRLIFATQPVLWRKNLPKDLSGLLWLGGIGNFQKEAGKEYYSVGALADAMKMYNETLLNICLDRHVECIDLASLLPQDTSVFYDDCHFNEKGSEKVAELISQYMLQYKPFKK